jgi:hypothetical protein
MTTERPADTLDERIARIAAGAPPLTDTQRARLSALLRPITSTPDVTPRRGPADQRERAA